MSLKSDILTLLNENRGKDVSGQAIAEQFGVSRNAVWKAIVSLKEDGHGIEAVRNRGYRLAKDSDVLSKEVLSAHLPRDIDIFYYDSLDSTNNEAKRIVSGGYDRQGLVVAATQTAGRGRLGRSFYSPGGSGIYMTLILTPKDTISRVVKVTCAAALAVCYAIESMTTLKPSIKWVNDVYLEGKKICGILTEAVTDIESKTVQSVAVGIGVNITTADFPDGVSDRATSIGVSLSKVELIGRITENLLELWNRLSDPDIIDEYRKRSLVIGMEIDFYRGMEKHTATAVDIDENGGLVVENCGRREVLSTGEISVRLKGNAL